MAENTNTEREASAILSKICDLFQIGKLARTESTILINVENVIHHARLLHAVERDLFPQPELPEDDDPYATVDDELPAPNSWAAKDEADYVAQFRAALAARASLSLPAAGQNPVAPPMDGEIALIEKALERVGISSLLNHGAASCVFTEGCCGVSQEHILAYTREIALHCAVALGAAPQPAVAAGWVEERENLRKALQFYADGHHFNIADEGAWDTVSGEPQNYWCDEEGTATVEDGSIAKLALEGRPIRFEDDDSALPPAPSTEGEKA